MFYVMFLFFKLRILRGMLLKLSVKLDKKDFRNTRKLMHDYLDIKIGKYSYGCFRSDGSIARGTKIGSFCSIADGARIGGMNHPTEFVTSHPILYYKNRGFISGNLETIEKNGTLPVIIEDDVWIGQNAIILPGVKVGKGSIIAAGAVVTKDIPNYSICAGVPAKVIKKRFKEEVIAELSLIDWTKWDDDKIKENIELFYDVDCFLSKHRDNHFEQKKIL